MKPQFLQSKFVKASLAVVTTLTLTLGGCRNAERPSQLGLLESVPADAHYIATVNLNKILKNAGCKYNNGIITLSPDLAAIRDRLSADNARMVDVMLLTSQAIDFDNIVVFGKDAESPVATFGVTDVTLFETLASGAARSVKREDGTATFFLDDCAVVLDDAQGWVAERVEVIEQARLTKSEGKIAPLTDGIVKYLDRGDEALAFAAKLTGEAVTTRRNGVDNTLDGVWACGKINVNNNILGLDMTFMDKAGQQIDFSNDVATLDTDFLRYIPENSQLLFALGKPSDIKKLYSALEPFIPKDIKNYVVTALPYLEAIDGTTAVAFNPAAGAQSLAGLSLDAWDATVMTHMPQEKVDALVGTLSMFAATTFRSASHDDINAIKFGDITLTYGNYDGYFIGSTREISADRNNSFSSAVTGKLGALIADIPYGSETMKAFNLPYGFYGSVILEPTLIKGKFRFNGTNEPVLTTVASIVAREMENRNYEDEVTVRTIDETVDDDFIPENLEPID